MQLSDYTNQLKKLITLLENGTDTQSLQEHLQIMRATVSAKFGATLGRIVQLPFGVQMHNEYAFECYRPNGDLRWRDNIHNLVTTEGLNDILTDYWKGSGYTASHFVFLVDGSTSPAPSYAAGDTMASHSGWTEEESYSESVRQTLTMGTAAAGSIDNSASKAVFSINADSQIIAGAGITTNNTKGGTTGDLIGVGAFSGGNKNADNGDTLNGTVTSTLASS